jgi:branched-chain amino acid aminotransferase
MNKKNAQDYSEIELRSVESLSDTAAEEPLNGVYLVARTYNGGSHVLELDAHFDRLERSAAALGRTVTVPRRRIRELLAEDIRRRSATAATAATTTIDGSVDIRFRVTAVLDETVWYLVTTEGAGDPDPALYREGVVCAVARDAARERATVKSTAWMHRRRHLGDHRGDAGERVYEHLLADHAGTILEGGTSNFYAVVDGVLRTAGDGVLEGIARRMVLAVAPAILPVSMEAVTIADVEAGRLAEAFISSATRGVLPVRRIDSTILGPPGPFTRAIGDAWRERLNSSVTPLLPGR